MTEVFFPHLSSYLQGWIIAGHPEEAETEIVMFFLPWSAGRCHHGTTRGNQSNIFSAMKRNILMNRIKLLGNRDDSANVLLFIASYKESSQRLSQSVFPGWLQ